MKRICEWQTQARSSRRAVDDGRERACEVEGDDPALRGNHWRRGLRAVVGHCCSRLADASARCTGRCVAGSKS